MWLGVGYKVGAGIGFMVMTEIENKNTIEPTNTDDRPLSRRIEAGPGGVLYRTIYIHLATPYSIFFCRVFVRALRPYFMRSSTHISRITLGMSCLFCSSVAILLPGMLGSPTTNEVFYDR